MKPGKGAAKGSEFERKAARSLSAWWFKGNEGYLWRRPGSGHIKSFGKGRHTGDIIPAVDNPPPYAWPFHVECKFYKDLDLSRLITQPDKSFIKKVWAKAAAEARDDLAVMLLVKENRRPELLFLTTETYHQLGLDFFDISEIYFQHGNSTVIGLAWALVKRQKDCQRGFM